MSTVITVENLGKKYQLSHAGRQPCVALRDVITDSVKGLGSRGPIRADMMNRHPGAST